MQLRRNTEEGLLRAYRHTSRPRCGHPSKRFAGRPDSTGRGIGHRSRLERCRTPRRPRVHDERRKPWGRGRHSRFASRVQLHEYRCPSEAEAWSRQRFRRGVLQLPPRTDQFNPTLQRWRPRSRHAKRVPSAPRPSPAPACTSICWLVGRNGSAPQELGDGLCASTGRFVSSVRNGACREAAPFAGVPPADPGTTGRWPLPS